MTYKYNVVLFLMTLFLNGCIKDDSVNPYDNPGSLSALAAFNAVPGTAELNLFFDDKRLNKTNEKFSFSEFMSHRNVYPGDKMLNIEGVTKKGEKIRNSQALSLLSGNVYSLFIYNDGGIRTLLSKDDIVIPRDGYAKVRLAHMVRDAAPVTMSEGNSSKFLFSNVAFKSVTDFIEVRAGTRLSLQLTPLNIKNESLETTHTFTPANRGVYTLMLVGVLSSVSEEEEVSLKSVKF